MKILNKNKGITLIALIITIIVMLILVGVSISMVVNGGLFEYAGKAVGDTEEAKKKEEEIAEGKIEVNGKLYNNIDDYLDGKYVGYLPTYSEELLDKETGLLKENAYWIEYDNGKETARAVIPKGFAVVAGINGSKKISEGLVITDEVDENGESIGNEFVWIPVEGEVEGKKLENSYVSSSNYSEPTTLSDDESDISTYYENLNLFSDSEAFNYTKEYKEMVDQVNKYNGFYIGRYETTIDENGNIGSKYNTKVLTAQDKFTYNGTSYYYRWYGLYYFQKYANVTGNGDTVQTAMIYGVLWDKAMEFIRTNDASYNVDSSTSAWHGSTGVVNSGKANSGDVALNIWDLESNAYEWTQESTSTGARVIRGGDYYDGLYASRRTGFDPSISYTKYSSRLALYIK